MNKKISPSILIALALVCAGIYLFISAPEPLQDEVKQEKNTYSINEALTIVAKFNDGARLFYTKFIVGKGVASGLKFDEDWQKAHVEAGPLPALFLRGISSYIEKTKVPLGLYLGSDYPIVKTNLFEGKQADIFAEIRKDGKAKFFYDEDTKRNIAIFPDLAVAGACVSCHNEHENSPKTDWKLNDLMGGTTWSYPKDSVSTDELLDIIRVYKEGVLFTYDTYLEEIETFTKTKKPELTNWPSNGFFMPTRKMFNDTLTTLTAELLIDGVLNIEDEK